METQCFNMNHRAREYYTELDEGEREKGTPGNGRTKRKSKQVRIGRTAHT